MRVGARVFKFWVQVFEIFKNSTGTSRGNFWFDPVLSSFHEDAVHHCARNFHPRFHNNGKYLELHVTLFQPYMHSMLCHNHHTKQAIHVQILNLNFFPFHQLKNLYRIPPLITLRSCRKVFSQRGLVCALDSMCRLLDFCNPLSNNVAAFLFR